MRMNEAFRVSGSVVAVAATVFGASYLFSAMDPHVAGVGSAGSAPPIISGVAQFETLSGRTLGRALADTDVLPAQLRAYDRSVNEVGGADFGSAVAVAATYVSTDGTHEWEVSVGRSVDPPASPSGECGALPPYILECVISGDPHSGDYTVRTVMMTVTVNGELAGPTQTFTLSEDVVEKAKANPNSVRLDRTVSRFAGGRVVRLTEFVFGASARKGLAAFGLDGAQAEKLVNSAELDVTLPALES